MVALLSLTHFLLIRLYGLLNQVEILWSAKIASPPMMDMDSWSFLQYLWKILKNIYYIRDLPCGMLNLLAVRMRRISWPISVWFGVWLPSNLHMDCWFCIIHIQSLWLVKGFSVNQNFVKRPLHEEKLILIVPILSHLVYTKTWFD